MSYKSRGNWRMGACLPTCQCRHCRKDEHVRHEQNKTLPEYQHSNAIVVKMSESPMDGSKFSKSMSKSYYANIQSREYGKPTKYRTEGSYGGWR